MNTKHISEAEKIKKACEYLSGALAHAEERLMLAITLKAKDYISEAKEEVKFLKELQKLYTKKID